MQAAGARRSAEAGSEASYCEREPWDEWGSRSSLSQLEEVATQSSGREDAASLRAERDALARALAAERQRAATAARAHDARLAELHGVIAELVRRRAHDKQARAIPEEDVSDECESTTQPAGELDNDADHSRTDQNDTSSALSPELPTPQESKLEGTLPPSTLEGLPTDTDTSVPNIRADGPRVEVTTPSAAEGCDTSLNLSERDSDVCLSTARCCELGGGARSASAGGSCERERGSPDSPRLYTSCTDRCESRQAKLASRVRLRKTEDTDTSQTTSEQRWCAAAAEQLALDVCAHADLREALQLLAAHHTHHEGGCAWAVRCARLRAERRVLQCALARAADTAHRLYCACAVSESSSVSLCCALRAADRALEVYDVLLALAETAAGQPGRAPSELVARQLLARLDGERDSASIGEPLLSPGPWLQHHSQVPCESWTPECEARLRAHAARLKADTVALRDCQPEPKLFSYHDIDESELSAVGGGCSAAEMEAAVALHDALSGAGLPGRGGAGLPGRGGAGLPGRGGAGLPGRGGAGLPGRGGPGPGGAGSGPGDKGSGRGSGRRPRRARPRHWLDAQASETDL